MLVIKTRICFIMEGLLRVAPQVVAPQDHLAFTAHGGQSFANRLDRVGKCVGQHVEFLARVKGPSPATLVRAEPVLNFVCEA
jgi:hypothetical protein